MVDDVLSSLDLNPIIATLGQDVGSIVDTATGALTGAASAGSSAVDKRSFELVNNILYSVNDYSGNAHTNRVLAQNGDLVDQSLTNDGVVHSQKVIGNYQTAMTFNGYDRTVERNGVEVQEREYTYSPFHGINVISAVFFDLDGAVIATQVLAESSAGGSSSIGDL